MSLKLNALSKQKKKDLTDMEEERHFLFLRLRLWNDEERKKNEILTFFFCFGYQDGNFLDFLLLLLCGLKNRPDELFSSTFPSECTEIPPPRKRRKMIS